MLYHKGHGLHRITLSLCIFALIKFKKIIFSMINKIYLDEDFTILQYEEFKYNRKKS